MIAEQRRAGSDDRAGTDRDECEVKRIEDRSAAKAVIYASFEPEGLANVVGRRERQDRGSKDCSIEQTQREEQCGKLPRKRLQRDGDVADIVDDYGVRGVKVVDEDRRGARNDDKVGDDVAQIPPVATSSRE